MPHKDEDRDKTRLEPTEIKKRELSISFDEKSDNGQKKDIESRLELLPNQQTADRIRQYSKGENEKVDRSAAERADTRESRIEVLSKKELSRLSPELTLGDQSKPIVNKDYKDIRETIEARIVRDDNQAIEAMRNKIIKDTDRYVTAAERNDAFDLDRAIAIDAAKDRRDNARDDKDDKEK